MANTITETVKGFRDMSGEEAKKREKIREIIIRNFKLFGFEPAETPTIEYEEFAKGNAENAEDEAISDMFKLTDKGKRKLALRYEFTFQLKRLAEGKKLPYKRYQIGSVFRDEPIKPGRFREFTGCDADIIGSSEVSSDAEVLAVVKKILDELKIPFEIQVNNRQLLMSVVEKLNVRDKKTELEIIREIDKLDKNREEATKNLAKILGNMKKVDELLDYFDKELNFFIDEGFPGASEIKELEKLCKVYGIKIIFSPGLARGLSYYNGNIFEIRTPKYNLAIAGGGRYDINKLPSAGIGFGLDRLVELAKNIDLNEEKTKCLLISIGQDKEAIALAESLRKQEISCSLMYGKPSKALEYANSYGISYAIFIGEEEVKKKKFKLKDMKTGKEEMLGEKEIISKLSQGL
jgi:histidyl-tRNA synthetase